MDSPPTTVGNDNWERGPMETAIKISAEVAQHDRRFCKFVVDRPVHRGYVRFKDSTRAKGSALIEKLFAIDGVASVAIQDSEITVGANQMVDWRTVGPLVGGAIRAHLQSGRPAVSEEALKNVPAEDQLRDKVQRIIDEQINPAVASHGGFITLLDVQGTTLYIKMGGGCQGCGQADVTLRQGIETALREQIPEIGEILDVSDHESGENPYYSSTRDTGR